MRKKKNDWIHVGNIGVDAGLCWIGDPCYIIKDDNEHRPEAFGKNWGDFCDNSDDVHSKGFKSFNYDLGHEGLGVCVSTGYGDGFYPVYVRKNAEGRVIEAKVVFSDEDEEDSGD